MNQQANMNQGPSIDEMMGKMDYARDGVGGSGEKKDTIPAKDEFFHSLYIAGTTREDNDGPTGEVRRLKAEHLQVRGTDFINMDECYVQFFYKRQLQVKEYSGVNPKFRGYTECFSWRNPDENGVIRGTSGNVCGKNSAERKMNPFCTTCKTQIIFCGFLCDQHGAPHKDNDGKLYHMFIRARGIRVGNAMQYIFDCQDLPTPFITNDISKQDFEKSYSNLFRRVVKVSTEPITGVGVNGQPWSHLVYSFTGVKENDPQTTMKLLQYGMSLESKIEEKFDQTKMVSEWWQKINNVQTQRAATGGLITDQNFGNNQANIPPDANSQAIDKMSHSADYTRQPAPAPGTFGGDPVNTGFGFEDIPF